MKTSAPDGDSEARKQRAWQLAQLVALLAPKTYVNAAASDRGTLEIIRARSPEGDILNTLNRETAIEVLLNDAEYLLNAAERKSHHQHAYQLFRNEEKWLAVDAIAKVFKYHGWRGLSSNQSVDELFAKILRRLKDLDGDSKKDMADQTRYVSAPSLSEHPLWVGPENLVNVGAKSGRRRSVKRYWAERIFLLAHLTCRDEFLSTLERVL